MGLENKEWPDENGEKQTWSRNVHTGVDSRGWTSEIRKDRVEVLAIAGEWAMVISDKSMAGDFGLSGPPAGYHSPDKPFVIAAYQLTD